MQGARVGVPAPARRLGSQPHAKIYGVRQDPHEEVLPPLLDVWD